MYHIIDTDRQLQANLADSNLKTLKVKRSKGFYSVLSSISLASWRKCPHCLGSDVVLLIIVTCCMLLRTLGM